MRDARLGILRAWSLFAFLIQAMTKSRADIAKKAHKAIKAKSLTGDHKKKRNKVRKETYSSYIYKVLRQGIKVRVWHWTGKNKL